MLKRIVPAASVTITDVAERAGVSIKTVSRVLNHEPNVREETASRVLAAIEALHYSPNQYARSLAGRRLDIIGLAYDNPSDSYLIDVQHGVLQACHEYGFSLVLVPCSYKDPGLKQQIDQLFSEQRISGLVLTPPVGDVLSLVTGLERSGYPYVRIVPKTPQHVDTEVSVDDYSAAFDMTNRLIAMGHRDIAFIKGHPDHGASKARYAGFVAAMKAGRIPVRDSLVKQGLFSFESGVKCGQSLLISKRQRPTAVFASNDDMAVGVLHVAHDLGIPVPEDLSIVGYDDTPLSRYVWPSLTTVRQPIQQMARAAAIKLICIISPRQADILGIVPRERFDFEIVIRQSAGALKNKA